MTLSLFFQHLANGISLGSLYALIAIGYTMVYGILRLINFAHGDIVMLGSYIAFYGVVMFFLPWWVSFPLAILLTGVVGIIIERTAYKPLREVPRINLFTSAVAVSFLLENLGLVIFGARPKGFHRPPVMDTVLYIGGGGSGELHSHHHPDSVSAIRWADVRGTPHQSRYGDACLVEGH